MKPPSDSDAIKTLGQSVVNIEAKAVAALNDSIDDKFVAACHLLLNCKGRIVVTGMGKSGHIGGKIAATLASTGSPAFFVHPGEASHGDLGMITRKDIVLALSNSGETPEILTILPLIKRLAIPLIGMSGNCKSSLAQNASIHLDVGVEQEACPLGLAPTSSTTAALVMGDALAVSLLESRGFTRDDFALSHPGGRLGRRLLLKTSDIMLTGNEIPMVSETALVSRALLEMTEKKLGMTLVVDNHRNIKGIFTDGDLRRMLEDRNYDLHTTEIAEVMTQHCTSIDANVLAAEALQIMESRKITALPVIDTDNRLSGVLHMHDLLAAGVV